MMKFGGKKSEGKQAKAAGFLKTGKAAQKAQEVESKKAEDRANEIQRFYMKSDEDRMITFLSGEIVDSVLDVSMWYEHQVFKDGHWRNWPVCVSESEPCPLCAKGNTAQLVAGFSIIDHTAFETKKGKVIKDSLKLFVCKRTTFKILQKLAIKKDGLVGVTFDVSRSTDNAANVGDMFDFEGKHTLKELQKEYGTKEKIIKPFNLDEVLVYRDAETMESEGFVVSNPDDNTNYSGKL